MRAPVHRIGHECDAVAVDLGVVNAGYYAINSLRLEKGYRAWGSDLTPDHNPVLVGITIQY